MKQIKIGTETIREIVAGEQYTVRPKEGFFTGYDGEPYDIVKCKLLRDLRSVGAII